jgi:hypothetical protein
MCVVILSATLSEKFLILRRIQRDIVINVYRCYCKYRYSCQILIKLFDRYFKITEISVFVNIRQWEQSCSMRRQRERERDRDGGTDMTKLMIALRNFAN